MADDATGQKRGLKAVPRTVWALGIVSLFMDLSSEMIHGLLPVFLVGTLGAGAAVVGIIEGVAEATVSVAKVFSGWLSDRVGNRKWLAVAGYGLAALSKPLFPLAVSAEAVFVARFADRVGKGIRGAPRDALVADVTPSAVRGAAFGLRQSLDTVGAVLGPAAAVGLMLLYAGNVRAVFWWALLPAALSVLLLVVGVEEPRRAAGRAVKPPVKLSEAGRLGSAFWMVTLFGAVFTLARFSEAFLILRAASVGLPMAYAPLVLAAMSLVYALVSAPAGELSDRMDRRRVLALSLAVLIAADLVLGLWGSLTGAFAGVALWGLHMGLSQGLLAALVADTAPAEFRGTAFGLFNLAGAAALLAASVTAGLLWAAIGPAATFLAGAGFAALALVGLLAIRRRG